MVVRTNINLCWYFIALIKCFKRIVIQIKGDIKIFFTIFKFKPVYLNALIIFFCIFNVRGLLLLVMKIKPSSL